MAGQTEKNKELVLQSYFQASDETLEWFKLANEQITQISKNISTTVTFLIPLIGSIVFVIPQSLLSSQIQGAVVLVLVALIISLVFGFIQTNKNVNRFNKFVKLNGDRATIYFEGLDKTIDELKEKDKKLERPEKADNTYLILQQIAVFFALIIVFFIVYQLLYK